MQHTPTEIPPDRVADCVLSAFNLLPQKFKPRRLDSQRHEWVPLAGIVLAKDNDSITCAALATGMKCLPRTKIGLAEGSVLHDWHAEVLVKRAFNRWLVDECAELARRGSSGESPWVRWSVEVQKAATFESGPATNLASSLRGLQPFVLQDDVSIHMYCSEAPCGDASQELIMAEQDDPTPWPTEPTGTNGSSGMHQMLGRGNFSHLGIVRRKPSRPDAPVTFSKSCSDKLALSQVIGILSGPTTLLVHPQNTYISRLILPRSQYVSAAIQRAFGEDGRLKSLKGKEWGISGYAFRPFRVETTSHEFAFSKRASSNKPPVPSNLSAMYTLHQREVLVNGVLQGRKQFDPKGASCVSRRNCWTAVLEVALMAGLPALAMTIQQSTYADLKKIEPLRIREEVKAIARDTALQNWQKNTGDDWWGLESKV